MDNYQPERKWLSFLNTPQEIAKLSEEINKGWSVVNLTFDGSYYFAIMEFRGNKDYDMNLIIPPKKKVHFSQ